MYYGITPQKQTGNLNKSVSEYISFIEINPKSYFSISEQRDNNLFNSDPYIKNNSVSQEKRGLSADELLDRMWTKGAYNVRVEVSTSLEEQAYVVLIPLTPDQIWNFNIESSRRHSTWFRHSKYTYKIDPNRFTSKKVFLDNMVSLGKWDISEEALFRYVKICEEDVSQERTEVETYDMSKALKENFNGTGKVGVGLNVGIVKVDGGNTWSTTVDKSTTEKITKSITTKRSETSDFLGKGRIYFYDPIVDDIKSGACHLHTYSTGSVTFGITAK